MSTKDKIISRAAAVLFAAILAIGIVSARLEVRVLERRTDNDYKSSVYGLAHCAARIDSLLEQGLCTGTVGQFSKTAAELESQARQARLILSGLPVSSGSLDNVSRFLSQVGDYSISLGGERLSEEQYEVLSQLWRCAGQLRLSLEELIARGDDGAWADELAKLNAVFDGDVISSGLDGAGEQFEGMDMLVYDGPFSDHVFERKPAAIQNSESVTPERAMLSAQRMTAGKLEYAGEENGVIPAYIFRGKDTEVSVCMNGGKVIYMLDSSPRGEPMLDGAAAAHCADIFAAACGYDDLVRIGGVELGDRCVFNYAAEYDGIVLYPDQIKITVRLDNGDICGFDARDYLMNHTQRDFEGEVKSQEEARRVLSERLEVKSCRLAVVASEGLRESLCYEFECKTPEGITALVSVNAVTLEEERVQVTHGEAEYSAL